MTPCQSPDVLYGRRHTWSLVCVCLASQKAADMTLLCVVLLLILRAVPDDGLNAPRKREAKSTNDYFFYNNKNFVIAENLTRSLCSWGGSRCYMECTVLNLTTSVTSLNSLMNLKQPAKITGQNKATLVFEIKKKIITCNITKCESDEMNAFITNVDLITLTKVQAMCNMSFDLNTCRRAEKNYMLKLINLTFDGATKTYEMENFKLTVLKMDMMNTTDHSRVKVSAPKISDEDPPTDILIPIEPFQGASKEQSKIGIVAYRSAQYFLSNSGTVLKSGIIRIETAGRELKDLSNHLVINFPVNISQIPENHSLSCQFYDEKVYKWDVMGSFTNMENLNGSNIVTCSYDHMTPFAVLLVDMNMTPIDHMQMKVLSYISYIGCGLSSFFSAVTMLLYVCMKRSKRNSSIHIHVSLSATLFLLNTSFMFSEWGATWSESRMCVLIAAIIQFSLLSCFSWMAVEAIHLYLLLIKVFNTHVKHYMVKLSLFGWGVPAVLVGGSLCIQLKTTVYGTKTVRLSNTNETAQFCWITDARFLYGMNITYFSLTFLFNVYVLVAVTRQIIKLQRLNVRGSKIPSRKNICTVLGLTVLLGMTWGLAFFTTGYTNYPVLYLFCICNSLQGLFMFLWFCGTKRKNRRFKDKTSTTGTSTNTSLKTTESSIPTDQLLHAS
ncbi:adhesion G protein-coupled receptor G3-like [Clarias magur]|uniref:Adhesion G protein-coupled receptor G3-like n=1 Tax=Clarias magur TaxID=1594786 RepID=A0A8J4UM80_CLAMG|nr:adhesion G protein-coupled receptor G3-like [Clarias magur]